MLPLNIRKSKKNCQRQLSITTAAMIGIILNHVLSQVTPVYNDKYIYGIENRTNDHAPGKRKTKILKLLRP